MIHNQEKVVRDSSVLNAGEIKGVGINANRMAMMAAGGALRAGVAQRNYPDLNRTMDEHMMQQRRVPGQTMHMKNPSISKLQGQF